MPFRSTNSELNIIGVPQVDIDKVYLDRNIIKSEHLIIMPNGV